MTTVKIELTDDQAATLAEKAMAHGLSMEEYASRVLQHSLAPQWLQSSWKTAEEAQLDRLSMDEIDAEITAARQARLERRSRPDA